MNKKKKYPKNKFNSSNNTMKPNMILMNIYIFRIYNNNILKKVLLKKQQQEEVLFKVKKLY